MHDKYYLHFEKQTEIKSKSVWNIKMNSKDHCIDTNFSNVCLKKFVICI